VVMSGAIEKRLLEKFERKGFTLIKRIALRGLEDGASKVLHEDQSAVALDDRGSYVPLDLSPDGIGKGEETCKMHIGYPDNKSSQGNHQLTTGNGGKRSIQRANKTLDDGKPKLRIARKQLA